MFCDFMEKIMVQNYFKIAVRNILKQKTYSCINISGLAIGITACIMIALWIQDELSRDTYHNNYENTYRIITINDNPEGIRKSRTTPFALANLCKENLPNSVGQNRDSAPKKPATGANHHQTARRQSKSPAHCQ